MTPPDPADRGAGGAGASERPSLLRRASAPLAAAVRGDGGKIASLQYARALAAVLVVLTHTLYEAEKLAPAGTAAGDAVRTVRRTVPFGAGVDVFFVISGFVMAYVSAGRLTQPGYPREYLRARLTRVAPPYWFYTTLMALALLAAPGAADSAALSARTAAYSYLFFPGWEEVVRPLLSLGWTLNYEVFFYLLFFAALYLLRGRAVGGTLVALGALAGGWYAARAGGVELPGCVRFWCAPIILEFGFGAAVAALYLRGVRVPAGAAWALGAAACGAVALAHPYRTDATRAWLFGVPAAALVAALTLARPAQSAADGLTRRGPAAAGLGLLGAASYTLYLAHPFVITAVYLAWVKFGLVEAIGPAGAWAYVAAAAAAAAAYSVVGYVYLELPLVRLAKRCWPGPARVPPPSRRQR